MKREFLKNLGIEDKEIIDKILDENSADIGRAKGEVDIYKNKVSELEEKITSKDGEIETLKKTSGDTAALKDEIEQLKADKVNLTNQLNTEVSKLQKNYAIESNIRDAKAKNVKAVMALLNIDEIKYENGELSGVSEQLENLKKGEDTSFLFDDGQTSPSGTHLNNPPANGGNPPTATTFAEAVAKAINKN